MGRRAPERPKRSLRARANFASGALRRAIRREISVAYVRADIACRTTVDAKATTLEFPPRSRSRSRTIGFAEAKKQGGAIASHLAQG